MNNNIISHGFVVLAAYVYTTLNSWNLDELMEGQHVHWNNGIYSHHTVQSIAAAISLNCLWKFCEGQIITYINKPYYYLINHTNNITITSINPDLELWNGHFKRLQTDLSRGLSDLQQQTHIWRVERSAGVGAHRHPKLPLDVHYLDRCSITNKNWRNFCVQVIRKYLKMSGCFTVLNLNVPGRCWALPGPPAERGLMHHVHSTTCATPAGKLSTTRYYFLPASTQGHLLTGCFSQLTWWQKCYYNTL